MILVDFSAIAHANITAMQLPAEEDILRHTILNSLRAIYAKHKEAYGPEMIIACDSSTWRRDLYPQYKWERRQARDDGDVYWTEVYRIMALIQQEIRDNLPWTVVSVPKAEADDVIAVIAADTQNFGRMDKVLIVGADSDYKQLLRYPNVRHFSNSTKKFSSEADPIFWLFNAVVTGQKGKDGIPNIKTGDDFYVNKQPGDRQSSITQVFVAEAWENRDKLDKYLSPTEYRNFVRNSTLIDFKHIPEDIQEAILDEWDRQEAPSTSLILPYLMQKRLSQLTERMKDFYPPIT